VQQLALVEQLQERVVLTLPEDFELDDHDLHSLSRSQVVLCRTPASLSLGESLRRVLASYPLTTGEPLRILHGDTVQDDLALGQLDIVSVAENKGYYQRARVRAVEDRLIAAEYGYCVPGDAVLTGFMAFANGHLFASFLNEGSDFIAAVNRYANIDAASGLKIFPARGWADCGHVNAYYRARAHHTAERAFNDLRVERHYIRKRGERHDKIRAELEWFRSLPDAMRHFVPQLGNASADIDNAYYDIEYVYAMPASDLLVFGRLPDEEWDVIFDCCREFVADCAEYPAPPETAIGWRDLYLTKTCQRLEEFARLSNWGITVPTRIDGRTFPSVLEVAHAAQRVIDEASDPNLTLHHGDLCLSNILYDARAQRIRVIDPRGLTNDGVPTCFGDLRYDLGKLFHSIEGAYDFVVAGQISASSCGVNSLTVTGAVPVRIESIKVRFHRIFEAMVTASGGTRPIAAIAAQLFLSMLPLHAEDLGRQLAFLTRAVDLFDRYELG
jgi:hypothetical protein